MLAIKVEVDFDSVDLDEIQVWRVIGQIIIFKNLILINVDRVKSNFSEKKKNKKIIRYFFGYLYTFSFGVLYSK